MSTVRRLKRGCSARENHEMAKLKQDLNQRRTTGQPLTNGYHETTKSYYDTAESRKFTSSTKLTLSCAYVFFLAGTGLLMRYTPVDMSCESRSQTDTEFLDKLYMAVSVACFTLVIDNLLNLMFLQKHAKLQVGMIVLYLDLISATLALLAWTDLSPIWVGKMGDKFYPVRYLAWFMSSPAMLYMLSLQSAMSSTSVAGSIVMDILMIAALATAEFTTRIFRLPLYILSCLCFLWVAWQCWTMFSVSIDGAPDAHTRRMLCLVRTLTVMYWSMFPGVWGAVEYANLPFTTQELLWSISECGGKLLFSSSLLHSNFMTIEQRKIATIKQLEDADRTRLLKSLRNLVENKHSFINSVQDELRTRAGDLMKLSDNIDAYLDQAAYDDYYLDQLRREEIQELAHH